MLSREQAKKKLLKIPISLGYLDDYSEGKKDANRQAEKIIDKIFDQFEGKDMK